MRGISTLYRAAMMAINENLERVEDIGALRLPQILKLDLAVNYVNDKYSYGRYVRNYTQPEMEFILCGVLFTQLFEPLTPVELGCIRNFNYDCGALTYGYEHQTVVKEWYEVAQEDKTIHVCKNCAIYIFKSTRRRGLLKRYTLKNNLGKLRMQQMARHWSSYCNVCMRAPLFKLDPYVHLDTGNVKELDVSTASFNGQLELHVPRYRFRGRSSTSTELQSRWSACRGDCSYRAASGAAYARP